MLLLAQVHALPGFFEPFSAITHLVGAVVCGYLSVRLALCARGHPGRVLALSIFGATSVLLLSMSGVYHMLPAGSTARAVMGRLDQSAIFALIAGTHTPVQCLFFRGFARWSVLVFLWAVAATGITLFSVFYHELPPGLGIAVYLAMGWIVGSTGLVIWRREGTGRIRDLLLGGLCYTVGAVLLGLGWPTLIPGVVGPHELWHVAVLGALALHWRFFFGVAREPMHGPLGPA
ncbi:MAG: hemolysin III family protein [Planctomycetota bacterium]|nr:hemolysin III family protein [Planctomycetota bacterium]